MKQQPAPYATDILHRIESIEKEVMDLKLSVLKQLTPSSRKIISLKGILKGIDISDEDIEEAKRSLYGRIKV